MTTRNLFTGAELMESIYGLSLCRTLRRVRLIVCGPSDKIDL